MKLIISSAVLKATDAKLTTDNWGYIMKVCDIIKEDPEENGSEVLKHLEKRLLQFDANVILRSMSLLLAISENCGSRLQQEISSKHFTNLLYSMLENDRIHLTVKSKIGEVVEQLARSMANDPSLRYMNDIFKKIKKNHREYLKTDQGKNEPDKLQYPSHDKNVENEELQEVLKLSLQEYEQTKQQQQHSNGNVINNHDINDRNYNYNNDKQSKFKRVIALYDLTSTENDELSFKKGEIIVVLEQVYRDWWKGILNGKIGIFPINYVQELNNNELSSTTREDIDIENRIFGQKEKINHLQQILKSDNGSKDLLQDNQISEMYSEVTPIRPQLNKTLNKYAKDKDKMIALRQIMDNAEATYTEIMNKAMALNNMQQFQQFQQQQFLNSQQQQSMHMAPYMPGAPASQNNTYPIHTNPSIPQFHPSMISPPLNEHAQYPPPPPQYQ